MLQRPSRNFGRVVTCCVIPAIEQSVKKSKVKRKKKPLHPAKGGGCGLRSRGGRQWPKRPLSHAFERSGGGDGHHFEQTRMEVVEGCLNKAVVTCKKRESQKDQKENNGLTPWTLHLRANVVDCTNLKRGVLGLPSLWCEQREGWAAMAFEQPRSTTAQHTPNPFLHPCPSP